ncbi:MAG: hypothetical protein V4717_08295 [Bacteroidota bacterium]
MKKLIKQTSVKAVLATLMFSFFTAICWAQENTSVKINGEPVGNWMSRNWMWVAAGVVLLILLIGILSGGSKSRRKTTIVREDDGSGIVRTTTTEIKE